MDLGFPNQLGSDSPCWLGWRPAWMGKPYSLDLRKRVVAAVLTGGMSRNEAAKQFGVGISTAINWVKRQQETGSVAPGQMGGHRPKAISGEHRLWVLQRTKGGDFTLRGLVAELAERGLLAQVSRSHMRTRIEFGSCAREPVKKMLDEDPPNSANTGW